MEKLFKLRKAQSIAVIVVGTIIIGIQVILFFGVMSSSVQVLMNQGKTPIETSEALSDIADGETVVISSEFLDAAGYGYYEDDKLINDYTLGGFPDKYILIVQPVESMFKDTVYVEKPAKIVVKRINDYYVNEAFDMIVEDYADYYSISFEDAKTVFVPEAFQFVGVVGDVTVWPFLVILITAIGIIGLVALIKARNRKRIKATFAYDEAVDLAEQLHSPEYETRNAVIIKEYLIHKASWSIKRQFIPVDSIAWLYMHSMTNRYYGIKVATTYSLMVYQNGHKNPVKIVMSKDQVNDILTYFQNLDKEIVIGYAKPLVKLWNESKDKETFWHQFNNQIV